jgi:hypothetical protein
MPVLDVNDYVFAYANITYDSTIVRSTDFCAAIPAKLGAARATDTPSSLIAGDGSGFSAWTNIAELEGPKGVKGFRPTNNQRGSGTEQFSDPKWKAPPGARLAFKFYCTEPQVVTLIAGDRNSVEIEVTASDVWQDMVVPAERLIDSASQKPMKQWSDIGKLLIQPRPGSDLTKILFSEFKWLPSNEK